MAPAADIVAERTDGQPTVDGGWKRRGCLKRKFVYFFLSRDSRLHTEVISKKGACLLFGQGGLERAVEVCVSLLESKSAFDACSLLPGVVVTEEKQRFGGHFGWALIKLISLLINHVPGSVRRIKCPARYVRSYAD